MRVQGSPIRLALEHGGLVGDAHAVQINVRVEPLGIRVLELGQEFVAVAAIKDVVCHVRRFLHVAGGRM